MWRGTDPVGWWANLIYFRVRKTISNSAEVHQAGHERERCHRPSAVWHRKNCNLLYWNPSSYWHNHKGDPSLSFVSNTRACCANSEGMPVLISEIRGLVLYLINVIVANFIKMPVCCVSMPQVMMVDVCKWNGYLLMSFFFIFFKVLRQVHQILGTGNLA